ncbi:MAG: 30S ribosomal protein S1 [Lachnospiraceae bacterium]|nr:30S ribosomal protein S1 [Lachnospiraceae bacterium]
MSEEQTFEQMLDASMKTIHTGDIVEGTVIDVKPGEAVLNIGYKADGVLTRQEYSADNSLDLTTVLQPGQKLEVKVVKLNDNDGQVVLSYRRMAQERSNRAIEEAYNNHTVLRAPVTQVLTGGLCAVVEGIRIFIPASLVSDSYEKDLSHYLGQEIEFVITEFNPKRRRYIGDRRQLIAAAKEEAAKKLFETLKEGDVIEGTVKNVTDFGAFVDLGGADGLLHISEMGWGRVGNPKKIYKSGQKVRVFVKEINGKKIALSTKFPDENPWVAASTKYSVGSVVTGRVARLADFGAFVELEPGVDGLLHVSQISKERVEKPSDVLKVGDEVTAKIIDFNPENNRISLSVKALLADQERAKRNAERAEAEKNAAEADDDEAVTVDIDAVIARQKAEEEKNEQ